jgi:hypothetical protein
LGEGLPAPPIVGTMIMHLWTRRGATFCDSCGFAGIEVDAQYLTRAWARQTTPCPGCSAEMDCWDRLVYSVSSRSDLWHAVTMAGGFTTAFVQSVPGGRSFLLRFSDYGIPAGSVIYKVLQTVQEDGIPDGVTVLAHAAQTFGGPLYSEWISLHPVVLGAGQRDGDPDAEITVAFTVVWAPSQSDSVAQGLLLSAFGAYGEGDMKRCLLDADSAVDISLKQLVTADLVPGWNRKLPNLGYEQRLLVLTAALSARGAGPIPDPILDLLIELRAERNKVAHGTNAQVDPARAANLISNALVAMSQLGALAANRGSLASQEI